MWILFSEMRQEFKKIYRVYKLLGLSWIIKEFWVLLESWILLGSWMLLRSWVLTGSQFLLSPHRILDFPRVLGPLRVLGPVFPVCPLKSKKKKLALCFMLVEKYDWAIQKSLFTQTNQDSTFSHIRENLKMFNTTSKYFSFLNKKPPTS